MTETTVYEYDGSKITRDSGHGRWDESYRIYNDEGDNTLKNWDFLGIEDMDALRGYFQAEEDKRLNRWRHPEHQGLLVYPDVDNPLTKVCVVDEAMPTRTVVVDKYSLRVTGPEDRAAEAYFEAHPESRPWHVAKEGEAWAVTTFNKAEPALVTKTPGVDGLRFRSLDYNIPVESKTITAAYRIFPKDAF